VRRPLLLLRERCSAPAGSICARRVFLANLLLRLLLLRLLLARHLLR
jgi:hypothetical protein